MKTNQFHEDDSMEGIFNIVIFRHRTGTGNNHTCFIDDRELSLSILHKLPLQFSPNEKKNMNNGIAINLLCH